MPSAADLPECPDCKSRPADKRRLKSIPRLTADAVRGWDDYTEKICWGDVPSSYSPATRVRHSIDAAKLIGAYDIKVGRYCSYFKHPHQLGLVVEARCGVVLSMGCVCGEGVGGYAAFRREFEIAQELETERDLQRTAPFEILDSVASLYAQVERRYKGLDALGHHLPEVLKRMGRAKLMDGPSGRYVTITVKNRLDPRTGIRGDVEVQRELQGLQLFGGIHFKSWAAEILRRAKTFANEVPGMRLDHENFRPVQRARIAFEEDETKLRHWLDDTSKFWTPETLAGALIKTYGKEQRFPTGVTVDGRTIVIAGPPRIILGRDGEVLG